MDYTSSVSYLKKMQCRGRQAWMCYVYQGAQRSLCQQHQPGHSISVLGSLPWVHIKFWCHLSLFKTVEHGHVSGCSYIPHCHTSGKFRPPHVIYCVYCKTGGSDLCTSMPFLSPLPALLTNFHKRAFPSAFAARAPMCRPRIK